MKNDPRTDLSYRKTGIVLHLLVVMGMTSYFIVNPREMILGARIGILVSMFVIIATTFRSFFWKTGLWSLTHRKKNSLDERELAVVTEAVSQSYTIFAILTVVGFYILSMLEMRFLAGLGICFLYIAHILPACILGWKLREI